MTNEERWYQNFECLKAYIAEHGHLPSKSPELGVKWMLNWAKYQRRKIKDGTLDDEKKVMFEELMAARSAAHTGGRKRKE